MRDSKYVMKLMSTYGTLNSINDTATGNKDRKTYRKLDDGLVVSFKYTGCFDNHYKFRHGIDDHNNLCHQVPSIEGSWLTSRWSLHVLFFLIAVSEVNTFLAFQYFIWSKCI